MAQQPLVGNGAGGAQVQLDDMTYFSTTPTWPSGQGRGGRLRPGGGAVARPRSVALVALPTARRSVWLEGALVALAVCATRPGRGVPGHPGCAGAGLRRPPPGGAAGAAAGGARAGAARQVAGQTDRARSGRGEPEVSGASSWWPATGTWAG
ncbi:hypothetical protein QJS66_07600 [Kocuria rhizophila]|nr:hypothetical protein QJS66_07600 [Kocuria rhizophila]